MRDHRLIDERSLAFGRAIAALLPGHPERIEYARRNIARWLGTSTPRSRSTLLEWTAALDGPIEGVLALLTTQDERATRLRQSNPFAGLLSQSDRNRILMEFEGYDTP